MLETIIIAFITAFFTAVATFLIQERKLKADLRTEFMAEEVAKKLLESPQWRMRSFSAIQKRLGGFDDDELRKILVRAGAIRFENKAKEGEELWGLINRNKESL